MKICLFKFDQNLAKMKSFTFSRVGEGVGERRRPPFLNLISIIIGKHMKMLFFKFQHNRTINEEHDFFQGGEEGPLGG